MLTGLRHHACLAVPSIVAVGRMSYNQRWHVSMARLAYWMHARCSLTLSKCLENPVMGLWNLERFPLHLRFDLVWAGSPFRSPLVRQILPQWDDVRKIPSASNPIGKVYRRRREARRIHHTCGDVAVRNPSHDRSDLADWHRTDGGMARTEGV